MSEAKDDLRARLADMILNLESQIRLDQGIIEAAEDARDQLIALDAAEEDIAQFVAVVDWTTTHLETIQGLLESANKIKDVI